jgi:hypothetical protein
MRATAIVLVLALTGCQTTGYSDYANAMARVAEANASIAREQSAAMMELAKFGSDPTTRTVAVIMLALGANNQQKNVQIAPPQNEALEWARVLVPSLSTLAMGYFGYRLGVTQSNNAADVSIAGYGAMNGIADAGFNAVTAFKLPPLDFSTLRPNTTTVTNTTTTNTTDIANHDGQVVINGNATQPAIVPPVVIVPPTVPPAAGP